MSYSNPRWYGVGDPAAFTKGFQSAFNSNFKNATDYFAAKEQELIDYNANLENRADNLRNQLLTGKDVTPEIQKQVETQVQDFLKEGKTFDQEGKTFIGRALTTRINTKSKGELDKAQMNFMASSNVMNEFLSNALSGELIPPEDLDRGSSTYLDYVSMIETIKKDPSKLNFKYKKGENDFDFSLEYKDPRTGETKTLNSTEVAAVMEDNNPAVKKAIVEEKNTFIAQLSGMVKTEIDELKAKRFKSGPGASGKEVLGPKVVRDIINQQVEILSAKRGAPSDINRHDLINDMFNNFVSFNDTTREQILKEYNTESNVLATAVNVSGQQDNSKREALSDLLDIERGDIKARNQAFKKLGITTDDQIKKANKELENYRIGSVKRYLQNEVEATGVPSEFLQAYRPYQTSRRGGSGNVNPEDEYYARKQASTTFDVVDSAVTPGISASDIIKPNTKFFFGSSVRTVGSVSQDPNTDKITLNFPAQLVDVPQKGKDGKNILDADGNQVYERKPAKASTFEYNPWDPISTREFYKNISVEAGKTGKYSRDFSQRAFDVNSIRELVGTERGIGILSNERGADWFKYVLKNGGALGENALIQQAAMNPYLYEDYEGVGPSASVPHWRDFYKKNKTAINDARVNMDVTALRNK